MNEEILRLPCPAAALLALLLTAACATGPEPRHYVFAADDGWSTPATRDATTSAYSIEFAPVRLPAYLDRPHIVTRVTPTEIKADQFHRWGNPLDVTVAELLGASAGRELPDAYIDVLPDRARRAERYLVEVDILRLDGFLAGPVELIAEWTVTRPGTTNAVVARRLTRHRQESGTKDYEAYLGALRRNVDLLGQEIAAAIKQSR